MNLLGKDTIFIKTSQDLHSIHAKNFTHPLLCMFIDNLLQYIVKYVR